MKPITSITAIVFAVALFQAASLAKEDPAPDASGSLIETRTGRFDAHYPVLPEYESNALVAQSCSRNNHLPLPLFTRAELWKRAGEQEAKQDLKRPGNGGPKTDAEDPPGYQVYVPADYSQGKLFGLIVWNSAGPRGDIPEAFRAVCDKHHLIWFGAENVGNYRNSAWRIYIPLEAATQARRRFTIDPQRVYISGGSGGGRVSSRAALFYPDTFNGAIYIIGCDYYRNVPATNHAGQMWTGFWPQPDIQLINRAKADSRIVILEGSKDPNLDDATDFYHAYQKDGFKHITYLEVPGMGHMMPPREWFEKAVAALDETLAEADVLESRGKSFEQLKEHGEAYLTYARLALREPTTPRGQAAQQKAQAIYADFMTQVAAVREKIRSGSATQANASLTALRSKFGILVADLAPGLAEQVRSLKPPAK
ncbi:MAG TPA: prolyl oligopeptidase family serine peptidase [Humisphaera sp.]|jgi:predicted esterase|nr:prolyl oligopeptidase family serine peptidase [Humisphaera sp.]